MVGDLEMNNLYRAYQSNKSDFLIGLTFVLFIAYLATGGAYDIYWFIK